MFKQNTNNSSQNNIETIIGSAITVKGDFNGQGNIVVEGAVEGSLKTDGHVFVGDKALIKASVTAKNANIGGEINGNINVEDFLTITATAKINGDIKCQKILVERGAVINGKIKMKNDEQDLKVNEEEN